MKMQKATLLLGLMGAAHVLLGQDALLPSDSILELPTVTIIEKSNPLLTKTPGSAVYLPQREIKQLVPVSGNDVLRRATGVHVVEEEGAGLRVNVGIRGLNPDRSRNVLILEDGVPVALNPYGEPEMYFTPNIDRMEGVEILKGSGQILFGPQTIGGVINYVTAAPPEKSGGRLRLRGGSGGFSSAFFQYGGTFGNSGFIVDYTNKRADNFGMLNFQMNDFNLKFKQQLNKKNTLGLKIGFYDEISNSTYIGLTQSMYDQGGQDFARIAPDDRLPIRRLNFSANLRTQLSEKTHLQTTAFAYSITRNWVRQDFSSNPNASNQSGVIWGDTTINGGALYMLNTNGGRNRQFEVAGIESRLTTNFNMLGKDAQLLAGVRGMYERANEQSTRGLLSDAFAAEIRAAEIRTGKALSTFAQLTNAWSTKFSTHLGVRLEHYQFERNILRGNLGNGIVDTNLTGIDQTTALIPGLGFNYLPNNQLTIFGGLHRGFAPPRVKDAIEIDGQALNLNAELSWNSEVGVRGKWGERLQFEMTAFRMDFSNQIIPVSESSGGTGTGLVNGGRTLHTGLEVGGSFNFLSAAKKQKLLLDVSYTFVHAVFSADRFVERTINGQTESVNVRGNRTPYAPEHLVSSALTFETASGTFFRSTLSMASAQFGDELNTVLPTPNGRIGVIDAWYLLDVAAGYQFKKLPLRLEASVKNLTDERFIVSRRPQGIRVALPRMIFVGLEFRF